MITSISNNASSLPISNKSPLAEKTDSEISFAAALQQATADMAPSTASASAEATAATETSAVSAEQAQIAASVAAWKAATESYMPSLKTSTSDAIAPKTSAPKTSAPNPVADQDLTSLVAQAKQISIDLNDMIERALQYASTKKASTQLPTDQAVSSVSTDVKTVTADSVSLDKVTTQPASAAANEQIVQNSQAQMSAPRSSQALTQSVVNNQPTTLTDMINKLNQESINVATLDSSKTAITSDLISAASTSLTQSVSGYDQLKIMMEKLNDTQKS